MAPPRVHAEMKMQHAKMAVQHALNVRRSSSRPIMFPVGGEQMKACWLLEECKGMCGFSATLARR
eukprot:6974763-Prymnesium_polylepis.1